MPRKDPRLQDVAKTLNEKIQDRTIRHMLYLERLKTREAREILEFIDKDIIPDLLDRLETRLARIERFGFDRGPETRKRVEAMISGFSDITKRFRDINTRVQGELFDIGDAEVKWQIGSILEELNINVDYTLPSAAQIREAVIRQPFDGRTIKNWFKSLEVGTQNRLAQTVRRGVVEGLTTQDIVRNVRGTRALNFTDGILNTTRAQTTAVVKSAVQHASNAARRELFKQNEDLIKGVQWVATLDTRTCPVCQPLDGKVYDVDKGPRPPIHINCRCTTVAVLKDWQELGIDADELPEGTRASINGQVPESLTYNQWLKRQPRDVVVDALGVKRAKLFLDGKLELTAFVTNKRQELTLEQLKKRESNAFKRAGL